MKKNGIIILGASGLIGNSLFNYLKESEMKVFGSYRSNKKNDLFYFDLTTSKIENLPLEGIKYGVLCSAVAKIDECKNNLEYSTKVNIEGLEKVVKFFSDKSIIPVFISGAAVFDGDLGGYKEEDLRNPKNVYGLQKKKIEDFIVSNHNEYLIIRLGKVFGTKKEEGGIFFDLLEKYRKGEKIVCAYDETLSLTYVKDVSRGIAELLNENKLGIFHIDSGDHKTRLDFAQDFFRYLGITDPKIEKCSLDDFNFLEKRAKNSYLDPSKFVKEIKFKFTPLKKCYNLIKKDL